MLNAEMILADKSTFGDYVREWAELQQWIPDIQRWRRQHQENIAPLRCRTGVLICHQNSCKEMSRLLILKTEQTKEKRSMLPVELALEAENDEVAAYLFRVMWHERYNNWWNIEV